MEYQPRGLDDDEMEQFESQINSWIDEYGNSGIE